MHLKSRFISCRTASLSVAVAILLLLSQPAAYGQFFSVQRFPTGRSPLGVADMNTSIHGFQYVAVANSGDNTVSLFEVSGFNSATGTFGLGPISNPQVPSLYSVSAPYGVVTCGDARESRAILGFLITSSSGNSVTLLRLSLGISNEVVATELRPINVGPQPYSAACYFEGAGTSTSPKVLKALVSTLGDNTLSLVDLNSGEVTMRIPNVPGSRALHGVVIDGNNNAWVAGTDANVVSVVNSGTGKILASFATGQPIAVRSYINPPLVSQIYVARVEAITG